MNSPNKSIVSELLEEEIAKIMYFIERHRRWGRLTENVDEARKHRAMADILTEAVDTNQELIEMIKSGE